MLSTLRLCPRSIDSIDIIADGVVCRLRICSEKAWEALPVEHRPTTSIHVSGLGWVCAVPILATGPHVDPSSHWSTSRRTGGGSARRRLRPWSNSGNP